MLTISLSKAFTLLYLVDSSTHTNGSSNMNDKRVRGIFPPLIGSSNNIPPIEIKQVVRSILSRYVSPPIVPENSKYLDNFFTITFPYQPF